jgi:HK97 family phage major capsid protein
MSKNLEIELRQISNKITDLQNDGYLTQWKRNKIERELRNEKIELEMKIQKRNSKLNNADYFNDLSKAIIEKRAIALNGTGAINQIKELVKELVEKKEILSMVKTIYGDNAEFGIPVLSPALAKPESYIEGEKNVLVDTQANLNERIIDPKPYISILPVSSNVLELNSTNFVNELPEIFAEAFSDVLAKSIIQGNDGFDGLFNNNIPNKADTEFKILDLAKFALKLNDYNGDAVIIMNPHIYNKFMLDTAEDDSTKIYKKILIEEKKIEGVEIHLTSYAPYTTNTGSIVAVGFRPEDYILALAGQINIEPIQKVGDTNTYFQATLFCGGTKNINKNFYALVA